MSRWVDIRILAGDAPTVVNTLASHNPGALNMQWEPYVDGNHDQHEIRLENHSAVIVRQLLRNAGVNPISIKTRVGKALKDIIEEVPIEHGVSSPTTQDNGEML